MRFSNVLVVGAMILGSGAGCVRAEESHHVMQRPSEAKWGPAPPMLPAGAEIAILAGNPMAAAPYSVRLKFPPHYQIPAHSHPTDENVVVVSGALTFGMGNTLTQSAADNKSLATGGFALMPAHMNHFAYTGAEPAVIVLYGEGPVEFTYVNPKDDPRNARTRAKQRQGQTALRGGE